MHNKSLELKLTSWEWITYVCLDN